MQGCRNIPLEAATPFGWARLAGPTRPMEPPRLSARFRRDVLDANGLAPADQRQRDKTADEQHDRARLGQRFLHRLTVIHRERQLGAETGQVAVQLVQRNLGRRDQQAGNETEGGTRIGRPFQVGRCRIDIEISYDWQGSSAVRMQIRPCSMLSERAISGAVASLSMPLDCRYRIGRPVRRASAAEASRRRWVNASAWAAKSFSNTRTAHR